jgi:hypothetical protein
MATRTLIVAAVPLASVAVPLTSWLTWALAISLALFGMAFVRRTLRTSQCLWPLALVALFGVTAGYPERAWAPPPPPPVLVPIQLNLIVAPVAVPLPELPIFTGSGYLITVRNGTEQALRISSITLNAGTYSLLLAGDSCRVATVVQPSASCPLVASLPFN